VSYLVIGDVHGCLEELEQLLAEVSDPDRELVFVGDLVSKGPDSRGVLALVREHGARSVRGNHDQHVLWWRHASRDGKRPPRMKAERVRMCESFTDEDWALLDALPHHLRLPAVDALVVHAGLVPGLGLEAQDSENLLTMRSLLPDGTPSRVVEEGVPWASLWPGPEHVLFGHDAVRGLQEYPHATGLDTGCVYGGRLSAKLLPEGEVVSVPALRAWAPVGGRSG